MICSAGSATLSLAQPLPRTFANVDWLLCDKKFLILDNDSLFAKQFCSTLEDAGVQVVRTAIQAPNMNAFAERWVQTVKRECVSKLILCGEEHLRRALGEFVALDRETREAALRLRA